MWRRDKELLYLGSFHGGDLPEMYGFIGDHLGTDAISMHPPFYRFQLFIRIAPVNFINNCDPNHPNGSTAQSLLSNITWPKYTLESKQMLSFSDDSDEYATIPDTHRSEAIAGIIELQSELGV